MTLVLYVNMINKFSEGRISSAVKRKLDSDQVDSTPSKMAANFVRSPRGLFKDYTHIYTEDDKKQYPVFNFSSIPTRNLNCCLPTIF